MENIYIMMVVMLGCFGMFAFINDEREKMFISFIAGLALFIVGMIFYPQLFSEI